MKDFYLRNQLVKYFALSALLLSNSLLGEPTSFFGKGVPVTPKHSTCPKDVEELKNYSQNDPLIKNCYNYFRQPVDGYSGYNRTTIENYQRVFGPNGWTETISISQVTSAQRYPGYTVPQNNFTPPYSSVPAGEPQGAPRSDSDFSHSSPQSTSDTGFLGESASSFQDPPETIIDISGVNGSGVRVTRSGSRAGNTPSGNAPQGTNLPSQHREDEISKRESEISSIIGSALAKLTPTEKARIDILHKEIEALKAPQQSQGQTAQSSGTGTSRSSSSGSSVAARSPSSEGNSSTNTGETSAPGNQTRTGSPATGGGQKAVTSSRSSSEQSQSQTAAEKKKSPPKNEKSPTVVRRIDDRQHAYCKASYKNDKATCRYVEDIIFKQTAGKYLGEKSSANSGVNLIKNAKRAYENIVEEVVREHDAYKRNSRQDQLTSVVYNVIINNALNKGSRKSLGRRIYDNRKKDDDFAQDDIEALAFVIRESLVEKDPYKYDPSRESESEYKARITAKVNEILKVGSDSAERDLTLLTGKGSNEYNKPIKRSLNEKPGFFRKIINFVSFGATDKYRSSDKKQNVAVKNYSSSIDEYVQDHSPSRYVASSSRTTVNWNDDDDAHSGSSTRSSLGSSVQSE